MHIKLKTFDRVDSRYVRAYGYFVTVIYCCTLSLSKESDKDDNAIADSPVHANSNKQSHPIEFSK
jgi:hypothetical protein